MRIGYVLLSTTFGMHRYTADIAWRMARAGHDVHLMTTRHYLADRYGDEVSVHTPCSTRGTGLSSALTWWSELEQTIQTVRRLQPDVVHVTGPQ